MDTQPEENRKKVSLLAAGLAAVVASTWTLYTYLERKPSQPSVSASEHGIAVGGNAVFNLGMSLDEYEARLKQREEELREELATAGADERVERPLVARQLAAIEEKLADVTGSYEKHRGNLTQAASALEPLKSTFTDDEFKEAKDRLTEGDTAAAEALFRKALQAGREQAATAAYQLSLLAESRLDLAEAEKRRFESEQLQLGNRENTDESNVSTATRVQVSHEPMANVNSSVGQLAFHWNGTNDVRWYLLDENQRFQLDNWGCDPGQTCTQDVAPGSYFIQIKEPGFKPLKVSVVAEK